MWTIIGSQLECGSEACQLSLTRSRMSDGATLWTSSVPVPTDNFFLAASAAAKHLRQAYSEHKLRQGSSELEVDDEDLKAFLQLRQQFFEQRQKAPTDQVFAKLANIQRNSPNFVDAYILEAQIAIYRFYFSREEADKARAWAALETAQRISPENPQVLLQLFHVALQSGRFDEAEKTLERLKQQVPGDVSLLILRARLHDARGESTQAIEVLRAAVARQGSADTLYLLALFEHQQGEIAAARQHLELLLDRVPNSFEGRSLLAQLETFHGDIEKGVEIYQQLIGNPPRSSEVSNLGVAYLLLRRYDRANEQFQQAVDLATENPFFLLNLADSELLLSRSAVAEPLYQRVVELVNLDPASIQSAQSLTTKAQALAHLGLNRQAATAVQEALHLAPSSGPIAFEAALVYALIGDFTSAMVNAERALERGLARRWFSLPWFDELREELNETFDKPGPSIASTNDR